jgi:hypothetical protein
MLPDNLTLTISPQDNTLQVKEGKKRVKSVHVDKVK